MPRCNASLAWRRRAGKSDDQVEQYEASGGRVGGINEGVPVVILTTVGRRSGKLRKSPLMRVTDGSSYVVIASMGGAPTHPEWYLNLVANPEVTLRDGELVGRYRARQIDGDEGATWWSRAVEVWPDHDDYVTRTDRVLPVVVLEPLT
jgi:deazaflavin-dependent oxidoreductase (nitroreductase family)